MKKPSQAVVLLYSFQFLLKPNKWLRQGVTPPPTAEAVCEFIYYYYTAIATATTDLKKRLQTNKQTDRQTEFTVIY